MGNNTLSTVSSGQIPTQDKWNQFKTALSGDLLPRNANGAVEDAAGSLGSSSERFDTAYIKTLDAASLGTNNNEISASSGGFSTLSGSYVDVTNLSVSIITTGRPVILMLIADGVGSSYIGAANSGDWGRFGTYQILRDATSIYQAQIGNYLHGADGGTIYSPASSIHTFDDVAAGSYTYKLQCKRSGSDAASVYCVNCKLVAYEV